MAFYTTEERHVLCGPSEAMKRNGNISAVYAKEIQGAAEETNVF
jgi:hypothetical protein